MELVDHDKGNYLRGLLLLIRKGNGITDNEKLKIHQISKSLDFNFTFIDNTIDEFFINEYLSEEAPVFSSLGVAELFLADALKIVVSDGLIELKKMRWISLVAQKNNLSREWVKGETDYIIETTMFA